MAKATAGLTINGFTEYLEKLQEMGGDVDRAATMGLNTTSHRAMKEMSAGIKKHRKTGDTQKNLVMPKVEKIRKDVYSVRVGFKLPGGLPARYIDRGTPTVKKDAFVSRALNKSKMKAEQREVFETIVRGG